MMGQKYDSNKEKHKDNSKNQQGQGFLLDTQDNWFWYPN